MRMSKDTSVVLCHVFLPRRYSISLKKNYTNCLLFSFSLEKHAPYSYFGKIFFKNVSSLNVHFEFYICEERHCKVIEHCRKKHDC